MLRSFNIEEADDKDGIKIEFYHQNRVRACTIILDHDQAEDLIRELRDFMDN